MYISYLHTTPCCLYCELLTLSCQIPATKNILMILPWISLRPEDISKNTGEEMLIKLSHDSHSNIHGIRAWLLSYRIRPIKRTMQVQVGRFLCSRGFVKHLYNRTPQWVPIAVLRTADRAELNAAFQTRQEERYVIWIGLLLGGNLNMRRWSLALAGPPKIGEK